MALKKKKQQNQKSASSSFSSKTKSQSSFSFSTGPKLYMLMENKNRLRRLLLNSSRPNPFTTPAAVDDSLSKAKKARMLHSIYEKLSCKGFTDDHIKQALFAHIERYIRVFPPSPPLPPPPPPLMPPPVTPRISFSSQSSSLACLRLK
ncbi:hypothetical protein LguiA_022534 [Lonicera macranthoides]